MEQIEKWSPADALVRDYAEWIKKPTVSRDFKGNLKDESKWIEKQNFFVKAPIQQHYDGSLNKCIK